MSQTHSIFLYEIFSFSLYFSLIAQKQSNFQTKILHTF